MANRYFSSNEQFSDSTGLPYAGGFLAFYASGTSTPLATYSNQALTIANTNPVVLDSAGRAGNIFLQNLPYKAILSDVNSNVIWTADPVYSSDYSTTASFLSGAGSPNGNTAGTQGTPTIPASVYWDTTNNILYVCTTTGSTTTAVWTAVNATTAAAVVPAPQGYLTPTSGVPIIPSDVVSATSIYYTPYVGNLVPIYNGSSFNPTVFTELQLTLNAAHVASNIYDVFVFNNSGVPTVVTGPTWSAGTGGNITAGSCARGTGAGGAALSRINGIWTNTVQITGRNGVTTYTINANLATYVGSLFVDAVNGQVTCHRSYGQSRKWGIWNAYNRIPILLTVGDATASWVYTTNTIRAANGASANSLTSFCGLPEETCKLEYAVYVTGALVAGGTTNPRCFIGYNSITTASGRWGISSAQADGGNTGNVTFASMVISDYIAPPALGINVITALESGAGGAATWSGTNATMQLKGEWRA